MSPSRKRDRSRSGGDQARRGSHRRRSSQATPAASFEAPAEAFLRRVLTFTAVAVDASSLIVLSDIKALDAALRTWRLTPPKAVADEAGPLAERLDIADPAAPAASTNQAKTAQNDALLVRTASAAGIPLLSEDRKILMAAETAGIDCFDALVALELLRGSPFFTESDYGAARNALLARNEYRPYRLAWAREIEAARMKFNPL